MRLLQKALTFDDVLLVPAHSTVLPRDTVLSTKISRGLTLNIPMVSAAMDTVTEANLAIALAQEGGIGFIHKNLSADLQAAEVAKVKRHEAGVVAEPITIGPDMLVGDVIRLAREHRISGLPVVDGKKVLGMVTNRDLRFETRMSIPVREVMTPRERLVTVREGASLEEAKALMHQHRLERVLVVDADFNLAGLMTVKDITRPPTTRSPPRTPRASSSWAPPSAWVPAPKNALKSSSTPASTSSWSTPPTVTPKAF